MLTGKEIKEVRDLPFEEVEVPEWGGTVGVQGMSVAVMEQFIAETSDPKGNVIAGKFRHGLLVRCLVGDDRAPLFTKDDIAELDRKSPQAIKRLIKVARDLNGFSEEVREDLEKK